MLTSRACSTRGPGVIADIATSPTIRRLTAEDFDDLLRLHSYLHDEDPPISNDEVVRELWLAILADGCQVYVGAFADGKLRSVATAAIVPNLTRGARPFAVIENVVTDPDYRRRGFAAAVMSHLVEVCRTRNCYKVMLLSARGRSEAHEFYSRLGFDGDSKRAFVRRL